MSYNDIIGTIGVALTLLGFFLNATPYIKTNGRLYYVLNIFGAALTCYASILISYVPFIILEGAWTIVSIFGLMKAMKIKLS
jgi:hypothetical protein